jgi:hypothetical protein
MMDFTTFKGTAVPLSSNAKKSLTRRVKDPPQTPMSLRKSFYAKRKKTCSIPAAGGRPRMLPCGRGMREKSTVEAAERVPSVTGELSATAVNQSCLETSVSEQLPLKNAVL